jgi:hypothetical protein
LIGSAGAVAALTTCAFLIRGIVLSGYPLYPSAAFGLNVDWQVPLAQVEADRVFIKTWSQLRPTYDLASVAGQEWVAGWLNSIILTQKLSIILPMVLMTMLGAAAMGRSRERVSAVSRGIPSALPAWALAVLWGASTLALLVWLTQAPAARFASIYFWIPLACVITTIADADEPESGTRRLLGIALACAAMTVFVLRMLLRHSNVAALHHPGVFAVVVFGALWAIVFLSSAHRPRVLAGLCIVLGISQVGERAAAHALSGRADEIRSMVWYNVHVLPPEPVFEHVARRTQSGLTVYVTRSASFRTPIPNTRYFNPYLELRTPADVRGGFRNLADSSVGYGYAVDYVIQPNAGTEIVVPAGE